jgi:hypothetical protein
VDQLTSAVECVQAIGREFEVRLFVWLTPEDHAEIAENYSRVVFGKWSPVHPWYPDSLRGTAGPRAGDEITREQWASFFFREYLAEPADYERIVETRSDYPHVGEFRFSHVAPSFYKPKSIDKWLRSRPATEFRHFLKHCADNRERWVKWLAGNNRTIPWMPYPIIALNSKPRFIVPAIASLRVSDEQISSWRRKYWLQDNPHLNGGHKYSGWENIGRHSAESNCTCHQYVHLTAECAQFDPGFPRSRGNGGTNPKEYDDVRRYELLKLQTLVEPTKLPVVECSGDHFAAHEQSDSWWANPIEGEATSLNKLHIYGDGKRAPLAQPTKEEADFWEDRLRVAASLAGEKYASPEVRGCVVQNRSTALGGGRPIRRMALYFDGEQFVDSDREDMQDTQHVTFEGRVSQPKRYTDRKTREAARKEIVIANGQEILDTDGELTQQAKESVALLETVLENRAAAEAAKEAGMNPDTLRKRKERLLDKARRTVLDDALEVLDRITPKQWADIEEHGGIRAFTLSPNGRAEMLKFAGDEHHYVVYHRNDAEKDASGWSQNEANLCDGLCDVGTRRSRSKEKWARAICFNFGDSGFVSKFIADNPEENGKFDAAWDALAATAKTPTIRQRSKTCKTSGLILRNLLRHVSSSICRDAD